MKKQNGFTILELMVVTILLAIIAAITIPKLSKVHMEGNAQRAMSALRDICEAQKKYRLMRCVDADGDGRPEFADEITTLTRTMDRSNMPILGWQFSGEKGNYSSGYCFQLEKGDVDTNEAGWVAWAWPVLYGTSGVKTFQMDCFGELRQTETKVFNVDGSQRPAKELAGKLSWELVKTE